MRYLFLLLVLCAAGASFASVSIEAVPRGRPFVLGFADPREVRTAVLIAGDEHIQASVGNYLSLVGLKNFLWDSHTVHFGLEGAGYFSLRQASGRFPLEHTDGLFGVYFEGSRAQWQWQLRYTHISSHLSDGAVGTPIAYSREYAKLRIGWQPFSNLHLYGGARVLANSIPRRPPWSVQWGGSYFYRIESASLSPFAAWDIQWKEESNYNPSLSLQFGLALNDPLEAYHSFRLFYSYYTGADPRGQFHQKTLTTHLLGIEMPI